jgi:hypothetical protein
MNLVRRTANPELIFSTGEPYLHINSVCIPEEAVPAD